MPFKKIGLSDELVQGILATGYTAPTEIQSEVIPHAIQGHDIIGCAQTGTGKTAAFVLPILNRLTDEKAKSKSKRKRFVQALILTPTRELAVQIEEAIAEYGRFLHLKALSIYGGVNIQRQIDKLRRGVDIVVATPGRLMDHMDRETINLSRLKVFVIDEADRMFDMGFVNDVKKIVSVLPEKRQTLLFSATMPEAVRKLTEGIQNKPIKIQIGKQHNPIETVTQHIYRMQREFKMDLLMHMLKEEQMYSTLIFSRTRYGADKISRRLSKAGIKSVAIHSNRTQAQRQQALDGFKQGKYQVMVATDIAARGIDVEGLSHVINYDVPTYAEDYVHRIGRTGRAMQTGDAITLVSSEEHKYLKKIEEFTGLKMKPKRYLGFDHRKIDKTKEDNSGHEEKESNHKTRSRSEKAKKRRKSNAETSNWSDERQSKKKRPTTRSNSEGGGKKRSNSQGGKKKANSQGNKRNDQGPGGKKKKRPHKKRRPNKKRRPLSDD